MNTALSFRKESIQQSSSVSEALTRQMAELTQGQSQGRAREFWAPTLTTSLTTI